MIVAPLLLGGVLMAPQARRAPWLGLVAALLPAFKLSYALPALVLIALSADWRRTVRWALAAAAAEIALTAVFFGAADVWRNTVQAQFESGHISAHALVGVWAQIAWNLSGLLIAAAVAWALRGRTRDRRTLVVAGATAGATLLTLASTWKLGTSLNSLVPSETALVPLAVAGCAWAVEGARGGGRGQAGAAALGRVGRAGPGRRRAAAIVGALGVAFAVAQGVALVAFPHVHGAHPFLRPGSGPGYGITLSADEVDAAVRAARSCPAKIPYSGTPIIAFIADRPLPADQPDQYLAQLVPVLRPVRDEILAVKTRCPREPPATH
jgi:hypothetical protein